MIEPRELFTRLFDAAVAAADPEMVLADRLPAPPRGRTVVVGAGKGAARMARALEKLWDGPLEGTVVTRYGHAVPSQRIEIIEAAHPVPDEAGLHGAERLMQRVAGLGSDDLVIALISGGGSALLPLPAQGLTLADEVAVNRALLASGAPISAMNTLRKHVSRIKGGRLAAAARPARVVTLIVSDVPGDDAALVSSGPTVPGTGTREEALAMVDHYRLDLPDVVLAHLRSPLADAPRPDDPAFSRDEIHIVASARLSLEAAAAETRRLGIEPVILSDAIEGEARDIGAMHAALTRETVLRGRPFTRPLLMLSGGETSVTVRNMAGRGGRNGEFLLSLALGIDGLETVSAFAADTDGIDGSEQNAGAFCDGTTVRRLREAGLDVRSLLVRHDGWTGFNALGDLFSPGPTGTNVNDLRAVWIR